MRQADGYKVLKALLPPPERRGLVLIDPPFETTDEFERLLRALRQGVRRFATGCYALWYPIKDEAAAAFANELAAFKPLTLELRLDAVEPGKLAACGARGHQSALAFRGGDARGAAVDRRAPGAGVSGRDFRAASQRAGSGISSVMTKDTRQSAAPASMTPV